MTTRELSRRSGADYYAVRRIRQGKVEKKSKNARLLCTFFKIAMELCKPSSGEGEDIISKSIKASWDGTDEHAQLIAALIQSTSPYVVKKRN